MNKTLPGKMLVVFVHFIGRALELLADIMGFFTERRLSFRGVFVALAVILALASLLFYYAWCNIIQQGAAAAPLRRLRGYVVSDLKECGRSDLGRVRMKFDSRYQLPLLWTKVSDISQDMDYEGQVICCVPRSHFGILATGTVGVTLHGRRQDGLYVLCVEGIEGSADFIREKKASGQQPL